MYYWSSTHGFAHILLHADAIVEQCLLTFEYRSAHNCARIIAVL